MLGFVWFLALMASVVGAAISPYLIHLESVRTEGTREMVRLLHGSAVGVRDTTLGLTILIGSLVAIPVFGYLYRRNHRRLHALLMPGLEAGQILRIDPPLHADPKLAKTFWIACAVNIVIGLVVLAVGVLGAFDVKNGVDVALSASFVIGGSLALFGAHVMIESAAAMRGNPWVVVTDRTLVVVGYFFGFRPKRFDVRRGLEATWKGDLLTLRQRGQTTKLALKCVPAKTRMELKTLLAESGKKAIAPT